MCDAYAMKERKRSSIANQGQREREKKRAERKRTHETNVEQEHTHTERERKQRWRHHHKLRPTCNTNENKNKRFFYFFMRCTHPSLVAVPGSKSFNKFGRENKGKTKNKYMHKMMACVSVFVRAGVLMALVVRLLLWYKQKKICMSYDKHWNRLVFTLNKIKPITMKRLKMKHTMSVRVCEREREREQKRAPAKDCIRQKHTHTHTTRAAACIWNHCTYRHPHTLLHRHFIMRTRNGNIQFWYRRARTSRLRF